MKKRTFILLLATLFAFATCKKVESNVANYYPTVKTLSVTRQSDGSAIVVGQVTSSGDKPILYAGFCMDTVPVPDMITNQIITDTLTNNTFTARFSSFNPLKRYYFRAWVANDNGYAVGNVVFADSIAPTAASIPCSMPANKLYLTSTPGVDSETYISISSIPSGTSQPSLYANTNSHSITLNFNNYPVTQTYKTASSLFPNGNSDVGIMVDSYVVDGGANVYVKQITPTTFEITICSAHISMSSGSYTLSTKFDSR